MTETWQVMKPTMSVTQVRGEVEVLAQACAALMFAFTAATRTVPDGQQAKSIRNGLLDVREALLELADEMRAFEAAQ